MPKAKKVPTEAEHQAALARRAAATRKYYAANKAEVYARRKERDKSPERVAALRESAQAYQPRKNALARAAKAAEPEKYQSKRLAYLAPRRAETNEKAKKYSQENKEKIRERKRLAKLANPLKYAALERAKKLRRRAQRLQAYPIWDREKTERHVRSLTALRKILEIITGEPWHIDHMYPLKNSEVCGLHVWNNLQLMPARLNLQKRNQLLYTETGEWKADY